MQLAAVFMWPAEQTLHLVHSPGKACNPPKAKGILIPAPLEDILRAREADHISCLYACL